jgi:hypothetical protein
VTDDELTAESKCWEKLLGWINFWCKTLSRGNFGFFFFYLLLDRRLCQWPSEIISLNCG